MHPHLINGFKYDMRIYVVVTCFDPLTIWLYDEGLVRFATQKYSTKNRKDIFCHLTNFAINRKSKNFKKNSGAAEGEEGASKWSLSFLKQVFQKHLGINFQAEIMPKIEDLIIKTIVSVDSHLANN